jgi:hypothetical protein
MGLRRTWTLGQRERLGGGRERENERKKTRDKYVDQEIEFAEKKMDMNVWRKFIVNELQGETHLRKNRWELLG